MSVTSLAGGSALSPSSTTATQRFHSADFAVPFSVVLSPILTPAPSEQTHSFVWWSSRTDPSDRIRFLLPVEYYPAGRPPAAPPPADYASYLSSLSAKGVRTSDPTTVAVGGHTVVVKNFTTGDGMDGSLGCPTVGADQADGCFGIQPEYALRIAVLTTHGTTILAWARTSAMEPNKAFLSSFDQMLSSLQFG